MLAFPILECEGAAFAFDVLARSTAAREANLATIHRLAAVATFLVAIATIYSGGRRLRKISET